MAGLMQALLGTTLAVGVALVAGSAFAAGLPITKAVAMPASAASGNYVSVFGGVAFGASVSGNYAASGDHFSFPLDQGSVFGAALGTHLTHNLRGEVEVLYARHATTGISTYVDGAGKIYTSQLAGNLNTLYMLGNLWYDIDIGGVITPYLGGGAGLAVLMPDFSTGDYWAWNSNSTAFAAQLGAGVKVRVADNISLDLGYRVKGVSNGYLAGNVNKNNSSDIMNYRQIDQVVQVGLTFGF